MYWYLWVFFTYNVKISIKILIGEKYISSGKLINVRGLNKCLSVPKGAITNRKGFKRDITMETKSETMVHKTLHRKLKIE